MFWNESFEAACRAGGTFIRGCGAEFSRFVLGLANTEGNDTGSRVCYGLLKETVTGSGALRRIGRSPLGYRSRQLG